MKKIVLFLVICAVFNFALVSCGFSNKSEFGDDAGYEQREDEFIIGTWKLDRDVTNAITNKGIDTLQMSGLKFNKATITFNSDNTSSLYLSLDCSSIINLTDDYLFLANEKLNIIGFDGKTLDIEYGGMLGYEFERKEKSIFMYGTYNIPKRLGFNFNDDCEASLNFKSSGVAYLEVTDSDVYEYENETGMLYLNAQKVRSSDNSYKVGIDGKKLTLTDSENNTFKLKRKK